MWLVFSSPPFALALFPLRTLLHSPAFVFAKSIIPLDFSFQRFALLIACYPASRARPEAVGSPVSSHVGVQGILVSTNCPGRLKFSGRVFIAACAGSFFASISAVTNGSTPRLRRQPPFGPRTRLSGRQSSPEEKTESANGETKKITCP